ncbi:MAG: ATPase, T2SS/T4P/T4SS family [Phycisphaerae bacterium]|jgi:type IV pilus assembly protein PilB
MNKAFTTDQPLLIQLLMKRGLIKQEDLNSIREAINKSGSAVDEALIVLNIATEADIATAYSEELMIPLADMNEPLVADKEMAEKIGESVCRENHFVPLRVEDGTVMVALANPTDFRLFERIQLSTGLVAQPVIATCSAIDDCLGEMFGTRDIVKEIASEAKVQSAGQLKDSDEDVEEIVDLDHPISKGRDSQVIRLVNHVLSSAVENGASDIHIEPFEKNFKVRFRIDGELNEISPPPRPMYVPMISRLKILAKMDIAERRIPQDGAIALKMGDKRIDLRVNTVPTVFGEKMVMRILSKGVIPKDLTKLGFSQKQADDFKTAAESPHGLLLVTGPTGSGKSTTLYSVLNLINQPDVNIMTVEDPVEYKFDGMNQVHVRSQVGLTFAAALRAFLRQDPDIIMVGEVRDQETAQICLRAALTGHMVLSTLHTNDALAAINRLADMGVEKFLLASALRVVEAQRLVRRLCQKCKEKYQVDKETLRKWHLDPDKEYFRPKGCEDCRGGGYSGRVGLFEVVPITAKLRDMISGGSALNELRAQARKEKFMLLLDAGLNKVQEGLTSLEEVLSTCMEEAEEEGSSKEIEEDKVLEETVAAGAA